MAVGTSFSQLLIDLRAETRRASDVSVSVDDNDNLRRSLNGVYRTLSTEHDWPHLRLVFPKITLSAGQRYYDYQTGFNPDRVLDSVVWIGASNQPIEKGIDSDRYSFLDSDAGQRSDPVQRWDTAFVVATGQSQVEFWPIPASSGGFVQFTGYYEPPRMVNDTDVCLLDDELVLLFASARQLAAMGAKDAQLKLGEANAYLLKLEQRPKGVGATAQMGLGHHDSKPRHPVINVKPSSST